MFVCARVWMYVQVHESECVDVYVQVHESVCGCRCTGACVGEGVYMCACMCTGVRLCVGVCRCVRA